MAINREIVYVLRMQNEARAAIQQLVADLRSVQGAMTSSVSAASSAVSAATAAASAGGGAPSPLIDAARAAAITEVAAANAASVTLRGSVQAAAIAEATSSKTTLAAMTAYARIGEMQSKTAATVEQMSLTTAAEIATLQEKTAASISAISLRSQATAASIMERAASASSLATTRATTIQLTAQEKAQQAALVTANNIAAKNESVANDIALKQDKAAADVAATVIRGQATAASIMDRAAASTSATLARAATVQFSAQAKADQASVNAANNTAIKTTTTAADVAMRQTRTQADIDNRQLTNAQRIANMQAESAARIANAQLIAQAKGNYIGANGYGGSGGSGGGHGGGDAAQAIASMLQGLMGSAGTGPMMAGLTNQLGMVAVGFGKAAGAAAGFYTAGEAVAAISKRIITDGDQMNIQINRLSGTLQQGSQVSYEVFSKIQQSAQKTGVDAGEMIDQFVRFNTSMKSMGASADTVVTFSDTLQKLGVVAGASGYRAQMAFYELSRAMAEGTLNSRELRVILGDFPQLGELIAQGLGVGVGQLRNMASQGKLTSDVLAKGVVKGAESINEVFGKMPVTVARATESMSGAFDRFFGEIDRKIMASPLLARALQGVADTVEARALNMSDSSSDQLNSQQQKLADMQKQYASAKEAAARMQSGGSTSAGNFEVEEIRQKIAALENVIVVLKAASAAEKAHADSEAASKKAEGDRQKTIADVEAVEKTLGMTHKDSAKDLEALNTIVLAGKSAFEIFGISADYAGNLLERFKAKVDPISGAIREMTVATTEANAGLRGAFQQGLEARLIKENLHTADGTTASSKDPDKQKEIEDGIKAVTKAYQDEALAKERAKNIHPEDEVNLANARLKDAALHKHGTNAATLEAQIKSRDLVEEYGPGAQGDADAKLARAQQVIKINQQASMVKPAQKIDSTIENQTEKTKEAEKALAAYYETGAGGAALATIAEKAHASAIKLTGDGVGDVVKVESQYLDLLTRQKNAEGGLSIAKTLTEQQGLLQSARDELSVVNLTAGARERALAVLKAQHKLETDAPTQLDTPGAKQVVAQAGDISDTTHQTQFITQMNQKLAAYKEEEKAIGMVGQASAMQKQLMEVAAAAEKDGILQTSDTYKQMVAAIHAGYGDLQAAQRANGSDPMAGFRAGIQSTKDAAGNMFSQIQSLTTTTFSNMENALSQYVTTGKLNFASFATSVIASMVKIAAEQMIIAPLMNMAGGMLGGGASSLTSGTSAGTTAFMAQVHHTGGIAGAYDAASVSRSVNMSVFSGAKRYHDGGIPSLGAGEVPIIAKSGEAIFPTVRMSDGTLGLRGAGGGSGDTIFAPHNEVHIHNNGGSSGDPVDDKKFATMLSEQVNGAMNARFADFSANARRSGGLLGNGRSFGSGSTF